MSKHRKKAAQDAAVQIVVFEKRRPREKPSFAVLAEHESGIANTVIRHAENGRNYRVLRKSPYSSV